MNWKMGSLLRRRKAEKERRERIPSGTTAVVGQRRIELIRTSRVLRLLNSKHPEDSTATDFDAVRAPGLA